MSFEELLRKRAIESVTVTAREIAELLALFRRDIRTSEAMLNTDLDWPSPSPTTASFRCRLHT